MKHWIKQAAIVVKYGLLVVGIALVGAVAVSIFGSKMPVDFRTCHSFEPPGMTAEDNTPLPKPSLLDTQVDGGVRRLKLNPTRGCILLLDNFDIENPVDLVTDASSN